MEDTLLLAVANTIFATMCIRFMLTKEREEARRLEEKNLERFYTFLIISLPVLIFIVYIIGWFFRNLNLF